MDVGKGFQRIIGVNGYHRPDKDTADDYLYLFDALGKDNPVLIPNTLKRWQAWLLNDGHTEEWSFCSETAFVMFTPMVRGSTTTGVFKIF